jgi:hypothetical protein
MSRQPTTGQKLSLATLAHLSPEVSRPGCARPDLAPDIVHFGIGKVHHGHIAIHLDRRLETARAELINPEPGQGIKSRDAFTLHLRALWTDGTATVLGRYPAG